jgi:hypothetical protein
MASLIASLEKDLLLQILTFLDGESLARTERMCKTLRSLIPAVAWDLIAPAGQPGQSDASIARERFKRFHVASKRTKRMEKLAEERHNPDFSDKRQRIQSS